MESKAILEKNWKARLRANGKYFGYPTCCIESFVENPKQRTPEQEIVHGKKGFLPCPNHAKQILEGKIKIEDLIKNRVCETPYPKTS